MSTTLFKKVAYCFSFTLKLIALISLLLSQSFLAEILSYQNGTGSPSIVRAASPAVSLHDAVNGSQTSSAMSSQVINLPAYAASDTIIMIVSRNQASASWTGDGNCAVETLTLGTGRFSVLKITPNGNPASFILTASASGIWRWWIASFANVDPALPVAVATANIGNNATSALEVPTASLGFVSSAGDYALAAGGLNAGALWTTDADTLYYNPSGNASLLVSGKAVEAGLTARAFSNLDRGQAGTTEYESAVSLVLPAAGDSKNLLSNPGFEAGTTIGTGWADEHTTAGAAAYALSAAGKTDGAKAQQMSYTGAAGDEGKLLQIYQAPVRGVAPGDTLRFSINVSGSLTRASGMLGIEAFDSAGVYLGEADAYFADISGTPELYEVTYTCPTGTDYVAVFLQCREIGATSALSIALDGARLVMQIPPLVTGVTEGGIYVGDRTVSFDKGSATLDGGDFVSGSTVEMEGNHTLIVTDTGGTTTVHFTIDKTVPTVSAGAEQTAHALFIRTATVSDAGSGMDAASYGWQKISGPGTVTFGSPGNLDTTIYASQDGTYVIGFSARDNAGNSASDTFTLLWAPAPTYALTVTGGTGSGSYVSGQQVTITASAPPAGQLFDRWTGDTSHIAEVYSPATTVTMPATAVHVTATYKDMEVAAAPTFSPAGGSYASIQTVSLSSATAGAIIYYTTDGTDPTPSSPRYLAPLTLSSTTTVKAIAIKADYADSPASSATYAISISSGGGTAPVVRPAVIKADIAKMEGDTISLSFEVKNASHMTLSARPDFEDASWELYAPAKSYLRKEGQTTIYLKFRSSQGYSSAVIALHIPPESESGSGSSYPDGTLLKLSDSPRVYVIINGKKKWISTPEVFQQLGYAWTEIIVITAAELSAYADYEDNLVRKIGDYKVYLVVNGVRRHIPTPEIFLDYGFTWGDVKEVSGDILDRYRSAYLIKENGKEGIYFINSRGIRKLIPSREVFDSYKDRMEDIQVVSSREMGFYPLSFLIRLSGTYDIYLVEGDTKRRIPRPSVFDKYGFDWNRVIEINQAEFDFYKNGEALG